ncbi:DNA-binding CsgD family transcriptional regulator/sugar-specific transcriptional regulator TrmB [Kitasatospora sp. MAP12-15]|uniref:helix-turn-helix transcriptional regulator n=1 Tax=unclassified Kitasatospora TaxID=2633591 RepID=UPI002472F9C9|nr:LuxR C-terminal-related transcriptional regulator [Kitasatospora sp. MAP12-44]MDH6109622.1 DNA-binding CsgD family transcriptional regulator/sugar-specific transcriptional regulator TrmB [Kitasatospora sp. MAP12-44]
MLDVLGLGATEERVYRTLLANPESDVSEICRLLGCEEAGLRAIIQKLASLSLIRPMEDRRPSVRVVSPDIGLPQLLARRQGELAVEHQRIEEAYGAVSQLIAEHADTRPGSAEAGVERVEGLEAIRDRLFEITLAVRGEVAVFAADARQAKADPSAADRHDQRLLERGVRLRAVYLDSVRNHPASLAHARRLGEQGGQIRSAPTLPLQMTMFDQDVAVIPADPDEPGHSVLVIRSRGMLAALHALFEYSWATATPLARQDRRTDDELTTQDRELIRLLALGLTDDAIAARMDVSVRTINRLNSGLMQRMGVRSRFQAGVKAVEHGWIKGFDATA